MTRKTRENVRTGMRGNVCRETDRKRSEDRKKPIQTDEEKHV
jgi:hypothetical protein